MARYRFFFWLDANKDDELLLCESIDELKHKRAYTAAIRDGLRLVLTLSRGDTTFLETRFPLVVRKLIEQYYPTRELEDMRKELRDLRERVAVAASAPSGLKPLTGGKMVLPLLEDDEDGSTLMLKRDTRTDAGQNFLNSMEGLLG